MNKQLSQRFLLAFLLFMIPALVQAQKLNQNYINYIDKYSDLAVHHMKTYKIPASIKLSQAILETGAARSELFKKSNSHFNIKCTSSWKGGRVYYNDDNPNDCFRKYKNDKDSYDDHSLFLTSSPRYAPLFKLDIKDYKAWARGLKQAGYATDPDYAGKLIRIIETYKLYEYDDLKRKKGKSSSAKIPTRDRAVYKTFGLIYVIADSNDSFDDVAYDLDFKVKDILKYNDAPAGFPLQKGDIVYLQKKKSKADKPYYDHVVQHGESMHSIAQKYGIRVSSLYKINKKSADFVPARGEVLRLR